tara:strand:+ start:10558 stop:11028 length:471 start_codon:yes stop_codon:yes gene_type:complete
MTGKNVRNWFHSIAAKLRGEKAKPAPLTAQQKVGNAAEAHAAEWLRTHKKFRILDRNWRHGYGELDLIARDGKNLVFIEVRARQRGALVSGYHSVTKKKRNTLRTCAMAYLRRCRPPPLHFRFDIIEVELNNQTIGDLRHYEHVPIFRKYDRPNHS